jgi:hypothetical protein
MQISPWTILGRSCSLLRRIMECVGCAAGRLATGRMHPQSLVGLRGWSSRARGASHAPAAGEGRAHATGTCHGQRVVLAHEHICCGWSVNPPCTFSGTPPSASAAVRPRSLYKLRPTTTTIASRPGLARTLDWAGCSGLAWRCAGGRMQVIQVHLISTAAADALG